MISILEKGLNFCPTPGELNMGNLMLDIDKFHRNLRLKTFFNEEEGLDSDDNDPEVNDILNTSFHGNDFGFQHREFKNKSTFNPNGPLPLESFALANETAIAKIKCQSPNNSNITKEERLALTKLKLNKDITIKKADKGSSVVIQNTSDYIRETTKLLSVTDHYRMDNTCQTDKHNEMITNELDHMLIHEEITELTFDYLANASPRTPMLYTQPKIHKQVLPPPCRPIVSGNDSASERISKFVDWFLKPIVPLIPSYIKDTTHFIQLIEDLGEIPEESFLVTLDVSALYTNIPHDEGINACRKALDETRENTENPSNVSLENLLRLVLTTNNFVFNKTHYTQISGTAMGTRVAPSYANIFMAQYEHEFVYPHKDKFIMWGRFIDDIFAIFVTDRPDIERFVLELNQCHPTIKFTSEISDSQINFLDSTVVKTGTTLSIKSYTKPTDANNYLLYDSCHPKHCKSSLPYSQFLRIRRLCSNISDFDTKVIDMGKHFIRRGYPKSIVEDSMIRARRQDRNALLHPEPKAKSGTNQTFLITTFHPHFPEVRSIIDSNWDMLAKSVSTRHLHERRFVTGFRRLPNIKDTLVNAKVHEIAGSPAPTTSKPKSGSKCKFKKCRFCPKLDRSGRILSTFSNREYAAKGIVDCKCSNLIYCITCKRCNKQYVGQTMNSLQSRFTTHFNLINNQSQTHSVSRHFTQENHNGISDLTIHIVDFIYARPRTPKGRALRDRIEINWIHKLRTQIPIGLNIDV